jgi:hypothetical protein
MKVRVKWLISPRQKYGIPRAPGSISVLDAKQLKEIDEGFYEVIEEIKPKQRKVHTRPVKREKED